MHTVLIVIHLLISVALIAVILMQKSAQDGGGLMSGSTTMGGLFTAKGSANLLSRTTAILATLFIGMSLLLGILAAQGHTGTSLAERVAPLMKKEAPLEAEKAPVKAETPAPEVPSVPVSK